MAEDYSPDNVSAFERMMAQREAALRDDPTAVLPDDPSVVVPAPVRSAPVAAATSASAPRPATTSAPTPGTRTAPRPVSAPPADVSQPVVAPATEQPVRPDPVTEQSTAPEVLAPGTTLTTPRSTRRPKAVPERDQRERNADGAVVKPLAWEVLDVLRQEYLDAMRTQRVWEDWVSRQNQLPDNADSPLDADQLRRTDARNISAVRLVTAYLMAMLGLDASHVPSANEEVLHAAIILRRGADPMIAVMDDINRRLDDLAVASNQVRSRSAEILRRERTAELALAYLVGERTGQIETRGLGPDKVRYDQPGVQAGLAHLRDAGTRQQQAEDRTEGSSHRFR